MTPMNKHLSVNTMRVSYKQIKKIKLIRQFNRPNSIFWDWNVDTEAKLEKAYESDA